MEFDFEKLLAADRYKIMTSTIVPRPIAWVTTLSKDGIRNAAPISFFNGMGKDPPVLALGIQPNGNGDLKDTARNIIETGEFVVNLVPAAAAEAMNATSIDAPPDVDELSLAGITTTPSLKVKPPRIALSPVAFECRLHTPLEIGQNKYIFVGLIVQAHVGDAFVLDAESSYIDTPKLELIGRMHGAGWYAHTSDLFQISRPLWAEQKREPAAE